MKQQEKYVPICFDDNFYIKKNNLEKEGITSREKAIMHWCTVGKKNKMIFTELPTKFLSIMTIFKNETLNLETWINHYVWQGVEHFYLIDNGSTDNPMKILKKYIEVGLVTYTFAPEQYKQLEHIRNEFKNNMLEKKTQWLIICDLDEFYYGTENNLRDILKENDDYDVIYTNWKIFGSSGLLNHPNDIRKDIIHRQEKLHNLGKYIFKTQILSSHDHINIHYLGKQTINKDPIMSSLLEKYKGIVINDKINLNHYQIQSLEYFKKVKMTRGDVYLQMYENLRDVNYFLNIDKTATFMDDKLKNMIT